MKKLIFFGFLVSIFFLFLVDVEAKPFDRVATRQNIETYLREVGLANMVEIFDEGNGRVYAKDLTGGRILEILKSDKEHWAKDIFATSMGHRNAIDSMRYRKSPSLQMTRIKIGEKGNEWIWEIDIDMWFSRWKRTDVVMLHIFNEVAPHFFGRRLRIPLLSRYTSPTRVRKSLEKWFGPEAFGSVE